MTDDPSNALGAILDTARVRHVESTEREIEPMKDLSEIQILDALRQALAKLRSLPTLPSHGPGELEARYTLEAVAFHVRRLEAANSA